MSGAAVVLSRDWAASSTVKSGLCFKPGHPLESVEQLDRAGGVRERESADTDLSEEPVVPRAARTPT